MWMLSTFVRSLRASIGGRRLRTAVCWLSFACGGASSPMLMTAPVSAQDNPVAGAVRVENGMIFRGMCERVTSLAPDGRDERIELRMIDQGYRRVYVASQNSDPVIINPQDWPNLSFKIPRRATSRKPIPDVIGVPEISEFSPEGLATVKLRLATGSEEEIQVAVTELNELFATITSLTHNWQYRIPLNAIPPNQLYPGILSQVQEFSTSPWRRLEIVRMLMKAGQLDLAGQVLTTITQEFPELQDEGTRVGDSLRTQLGEQILEELNRRQAAGQFQLAVSAARLFPKENLAPETLVRANQIVSAAEATQARILTLQTRLQKLPSTIADPEQSRRATEMIREALKELSPHTVDRFAPFELLGDDDGDPLVSVSLAISGWLLGPEAAIQGFQETSGLFEARLLTVDFLRTTPDEQSVRLELLSQIEKLEGVSPDRLASMIRHLPSPEPLRFQTSKPLSEGRFQIPGTEEVMGCTGIVPPEYSESRSYPLLIAFPRELTDPARAVDVWVQMASRYGYVVVVPQAWEDGAGEYDASAVTHTRFLALLRQIKRGIHIDDTRVYAAGHGIGGEAAIDIATAHPDQFAGVASIASLGREHFKWTASNHAGLPWYVVVGEKQGNWHARLGVLLQRLFRRESETRLLTDLTFVVYPNRGFERFFEEMPSLFDWMGRHTRERFPNLIHTNLMRSTDRDWFYLHLDSVPGRFAELDAPSKWNDARRFRTATLECRLTENNGILLNTLPAPGQLHLSPGMPGIDLDKTITVVVGGKRKTVDYDPQISDMLTELYESGDRDRLTFMKVPVEPR